MRWAAMGWARQLATRGMRAAWARRAALRVARRRGRALVLVYHRVSPEGPAAHEVVRSLPSSLFAQQLRTLAQMGEIIPLAELPAACAAQRGPYFAITFDDDHACHREHTLAVLRAEGVQATFFLSGRALHGIGPYWWSLIEESTRTRGLEATRQLLGLSGETPANLAVALEGSARLEQLPHLLEGSQTPRQPQPQTPSPPPGLAPLRSAMSADDIRTLTDAGMTIGFHTLRHPVLTQLSPVARDTALTEGRQALAAAAGAPVDLLAYPHGRADASVAAAAERAGFVAAYAAGGRPIAAGSDRFLLDRWEPGFLDGDTFAAAVTARLLRPATPSRRRRHDR